MIYVAIPKHGLFQDLTGMKFGRLIVAGYLGRIGRNNCWECVCDCGSKSIVNGGNLKTGHTQSCGCFHKERTSATSVTHGKSKTNEYSIWAAMKARCYDESNSSYGGRGIAVCERWLTSFANFLADMGPRPSPAHSIDRRNNNGNYEPGNCRWATPKVQANNTRSTVLIHINGETKPLSMWADEYSLAKSVIVARIDNGDTGEALIRPSGLRTKRLTFNGITDTYSGWSCRTGIKPETISQRMRRNGWSIEKTLTKGVSSCK